MSNSLDSLNPLVYITTHADLYLYLLCLDELGIAYTNSNPLPGYYLIRDSMLAVFDSKDIDETTMEYIQFLTLKDFIHLYLSKVDIHNHELILYLSKTDINPVNTPDTEQCPFKFGDLIWCWDADNPSKKIQHHFIAYNKDAKSPYIVTSKYCIDKSPPIFNAWSFECASASVVTLTAQDISEGKGVGVDPNLIHFKEK